MTNIYYKPNEVWNLVNTCYDQETLIAENVDAGVAIYAVVSDMIPSLTIVFDDSEPVEEAIPDELSCEEIVECAYYYYLLDEEDFDEASMSTEELEIKEREEDLDTLVYDFVTEISGEIPKRDDEELAKIKDRLIEVLYTEFDIDPYRPMMLVNNETNTEIYKEYPYQFLY